MPVLPLFSSLSNPLLNPEKTNNLCEAQKWATHILTQAASLSDMTCVTLSMCDRVLIGSSAFSGVETPGCSDGCIAAAVKAQCGKLGIKPERAIKYKQAWAIEMDYACQEENLNKIDHPECLFNNLEGFIELKYRKDCGLD
eukprot:4484172-Karenia_brevis.AAC.1